MPKLIRFVIMNSAIGIVIGWVIAASLVLMNIGGLGELYANTNFKIAVAAMLGLTFGTTFGFAYLATAVFLIPTTKEKFDKM